MKRYKFWIFDMDGTLTKSVHDFIEIKKELKIPVELDILAGIKTLDESVQEKKIQELKKIEERLALIASSNEYVEEVLEKILHNQNKIAVLTRNDSNNTETTLKTSGLKKYFSDEFIITRESFPPKPEPDGVIHLLNKWNAKKEETVLFGDYIYDLDAAKNSGISRGYFDPTKKFIYKDSSDYQISSFKEILDQIR
jgi:HAD superfamily hydrolase (TIGR01509 family)